MKVIVRCANDRITKTEMEREIERLFQENKDLRLSEAHLRDEVNILRQQSEARRQAICERNKLIQELDEELANTKASVEIQRGFREEMAEEIEALEKELAKSESESSQGMNTMVKFWEEAVKEKNKAEERAEEYRIALMESDCRVDECEKRMDWLSKEVLEWKATAEGYKNQYEELKAQKEADDKKSEEICTACNERYEDVLSDRNRLREEVARLTNERNTAVNENTLMMFDINELRDKCKVEHNLRTEANKQIEELEAEVDACHHNIDGYIEGNRRMRAEYEKKLETEQNQTKHWRKKYDEVLQKMEGYKTQLIVTNQENLARAKAMEQLQEEYNELEANFDELERVHKLWGEEIDRLRRVVTELQSNRFTTDEFIGMIMKNFMPSTDK